MTMRMSMKCKRQPLAIPDEDLDEIDSPDKADSADEDTVDRMIVKCM